ncbi:MAG: AAA family ATPase [Bryobacteraceae bacterium]
MSASQFEDRSVNPFGRMVGHPLEDEPDVAEINSQAFETCRKTVLDVARIHEGAAVTIRGEAGTGKTHLLGRIRKWLATQPGSVFVFAPMATGGRMLWRHLRARFVDALLRENSAGTRPLDGLLANRAKVQRRDLAIALELLASGAQMRDAAAWLRGQDLPDAALERMEISPPGSDDDALEAASRDTIASLCALAEPGVVVFCLDQMEALETFPGDTAGLHALGNAVTYLHDNVRNVCVICCVQSGFFQQLEKTLSRPAQDRLLARRDSLNPLDWEQAKLLVSARLGLPPDRWPIDAKAIQQVFVDGAAPARKIITRCKDLYDLLRPGSAPAATPNLDAALGRMLDERAAPTDPGDSDAVMRGGLPFFLSARQIAFRTLGEHSPFDLELPEKRCLVGLCNQQNSTSLAARLRKVQEQWNPFTHPNLVLLRDTRIPIGPSADKTRERLEAIAKKGGKLVSVSKEALEALAALRRLLADAQSGDLAFGGDSVPPKKVEEWIAGHMPAVLDPLLRAFSGGASPEPAELAARLVQLVAERKVIAVAEAARVIGAKPEEVERCARRDPRLVGWLGGPAPALFQPINAD